MGTINFLNSVEDTFPYIESSIMILDNNLNWWKKNFSLLEEEVSNQLMAIVSKPIDIRIRFTIYNGPDENVKTVKWNGPAIEFTFLELSENKVKQLKEKLGQNTWKGHKMFIEDNKLYIFFE